MSDSGGDQAERFVDDAERRSRLIAEIRELRAAILELMDDASIAESDRESVVKSMENIERKLHASDQDSSS